MAILFETFKNVELDSEPAAKSNAKKMHLKKGKKQQAWTHIARRPTAIYSSNDVNMLVQTHRTLWSMPPMRAACCTQHMLHLPSPNRLDTGILGNCGGSAARALVYFQFQLSNWANGMGVARIIIILYNVFNPFATNRANCFWSIN